MPLPASSNSFVDFISYNRLMTAPNAPFTIGIIDTFMFPSFFQFSCKFLVLISLFAFFRFYPSMLASPLPSSFLDTYNLSMSPLGYKALFIVIGFLILWSICWSSSIVHFKNGPEYLMRIQPRCLSFWWEFCYIVWFRVVFLSSRDTLFKFNFFFFHLHLFNGICL